MSTTSFTYFQAEDRLLVVIQPGDHKLWLTRRLTRSILHEIAELFASKVPGEGIPGAGSQADRIAFEHRMAMNGEDLQEQQDDTPPMQFSETPPAAADDDGIRLCTGLDVTVGDNYAKLSLVSEDITLTLRQSRAGFHRFLRSIQLCADKAGWDMQSSPVWLRQSLIAGLLDNLPPLDEEDDNHEHDG